VRAPSCCSRQATAEAKRCSPEMSVLTMRYLGGCSWLDLWVRPSCCTYHSNKAGVCADYLTHRMWMQSKENWSNSTHDHQSAATVNLCTCTVQHLYADRGTLWGGCCWGEDLCVGPPVTPAREGWVQAILGHWVVLVQQSIV